MPFVEAEIEDSCGEIVVTSAPISRDSQEQGRDGEERSQAKTPNLESLFEDTTEYLLEDDDDELEGDGVETEGLLAGSSPHKVDAYSDPYGGYAASHGGTLSAGCVRQGGETKKSALCIGLGLAVATGLFDGALMVPFLEFKKQCLVYQCSDDDVAFRYLYGFALAVLISIG